MQAIALAAGDGVLLTRIPTIDNVLGEHSTSLGRDLVGYRHHGYRIANLSVAMAAGFRSHPLTLPMIRL